MKKLSDIIAKYGLRPYLNDWAIVVGQCLEPHLIQLIIAENWNDVDNECLMEFYDLLLSNLDEFHEEMSADRREASLMLLRSFREKVPEWNRKHWADFLQNTALDYIVSEL